jgi:hypothetical protein
LHPAQSIGIIEAFHFHLKLYAVGAGLYARTPMDHKPKLLDLVRQTIRLKHYSIRTERAYAD